MKKGKFCLGLMNQGVCVCMWVIKDLEKEELPPHMVRVMPSEIKRVHVLKFSVFY